MYSYHHQGDIRARNNISVTSNRSTLPANTIEKGNSLIIVTLMTDALLSSDRRLLPDPYGVTSQKTEFFSVTAVKTSSLTSQAEL
jgi:hypothetical protein